MPEKKLKFYILGASGFLGGRCFKYLKSRGHKVLTKRIDVTNLSVLVTEFKKTKPDVIINFAGAKAYPTIDWCEDHKKETVAINVVGAINVTLAALEAKSYPIQISSGCIYNGGIKQIFTEEDEPNFFGSFYSRMRVVMQNALKELPVLQARIRMPISMYPHPRNFLNKIISYKKLISVPNSVTLIEDLFPALEKISYKKPTGILNLTNDGYIKHKDILEAYKKIINPKHKYTLITLKELHGQGGITKSKRSNCLLSNKKAKSMGIEMPPLDNKRLKEIMNIYKRQLK